MRSKRNTFPRPKEESIHRMVAEYIKIQYPKVIFRTDFAAGIRMTIGQAVKHKKLQSSDKYPDLFLAEPRGGYAGLYLELKRDESEVFTKKGEWREDEHVKGQREMLRKLREKGYSANFGLGFEDAKIAIDQYMSLKQYDIVSIVNEFQNTPKILA